MGKSLKFQQNHITCPQKKSKIENVMSFMIRVIDILVYFRNAWFGGRRMGRRSSSKSDFLLNNSLILLPI